MKMIFSTFLLLAASGVALCQEAIQTGRELFEQKHFDQAVAFFEANERAMRGDPQFHYYYGLSLYKTGAAKQAIESLEQADTLSPGNSGYQLALGLAHILYLDQVSFIRKPFVGNKILPLLEKAAVLDSNNYPAQSYYIRQLTFLPGMAGGDLEKATQLANELSRRNKSWGAFVKAMIAIKEERSDDIITHFQMAVEGDSHIPEAEFWYASHLQEAGLNQQALEHFNKYISMEADWYEPDIWEAYFRMGNIYKAEGRQALAREKLSLALQHAPYESIRETVEEAMDAL